MTDYRKIHTFEPSGEQNLLGRELCICGLPYDIASMHYENRSFFDLSDDEKKEIVQKAAEDSNKAQRDTIATYRTLREIMSLVKAYKMNKDHGDVWLEAQIGHKLELFRQEIKGGL